MFIPELGPHQSGHWTSDCGRFVLDLSDLVDVDLKTCLSR